MSLPSMAYAKRTVTRTQVKFGGYDHNLCATDGDIYDMTNMSGDLYPLLSPRKPRYLVRRLDAPNGLYTRDALFYVDGTVMYKDGEAIGAVADSRKRFVSLGPYVIVSPDMVYYNTLTGEFGTLTATWTGSVLIGDGTYAGETAEANTIIGVDADFSKIFHVGDAVTITGCIEHSENNKTPIIREIEGNVLRFYENSFVIGDNGDAEVITITRTIPDMEYLCENENRLWGCKGDTVYASKLGDPFNWNVFDGVATDSYAVDVGSAGDFTGCASFLGYPCFFKEEHIYKMYGDKPSNFQLMGSATLGVQAGSADSLHVAGEVLFYLSRAGVVAYSGGVPQIISAPLGTERFKNATAGSDGRKYVVSMEGEDGDSSLFVFDTRTKLWHREDEVRAIGFGWKEGLYFLTDAGELWLNGDACTVPDGAVTEGTVESVVEFGDFTEGEASKKGVSKLLLRLEVKEGESVTVDIQFDSDGCWREVKTLTALGKRSFYLPIVPHRCDHFRIRLRGTGEWRLSSLTRESYSGSEY